MWYKITLNLDCHAPVTNAAGKMCDCADFHAKAKPEMVVQTNPANGVLHDLNDRVSSKWARDCYCHHDAITEA